MIEIIGIIIVFLFGLAIGYFVGREVGILRGRYGK